MSEQSPPRLAQALIRFIIRGNDQPSVLGDLEEMFASDVLKRGRRQAAISYWKEAVVAVAYAILRSVERHRVPVFSLLLGVLGGVVMIDVTLISRRGSLAVFVYAGVMFAAAVYFTIMSVESFARRFLLGLAAFMTTTMLMYWHAELSPLALPLPLWGHAVRLGAALTLGSIAAAIAAAFSRRKTAQFLIFPLIPVVACAFLTLTRPSHAVRSIFQVILPFTLLVNWRHDGWAWAFAGVDLLVWSLLGWLFLQWSSKTRSPHQPAPATSR
jgi:hypothetical protein